MINKRNGIGGPFAYCDYWASVLGLRSIINPLALKANRIDLDLFRHALDRPSARLHNWRIYALATLLGPGTILYQRVTRLRRKIESQEERRRQKMLSERLEPHRLDLEPDPQAPGSVRLKGVDGHWDGPLPDPNLLRVVASTIFSTSKMLIATLITLLYAATIFPLLGHLEVPLLSNLTFIVLSYFGLTVLLYALFGDIWAALLGPIPLLIARKLLVFSHGIDGFYLGLVGILVLVVLVEFFFVPRPVPPVLYLYVNEPGHPLQTYRPGEAPYWLNGKAYWVWRLVILAPAEITKFWERDWERVEVWVRADEGPDCGKIEWIVSDFHYRELWYKPESWIGRRRLDQLETKLSDWRCKRKSNAKSAFHWLLEVDLDLLFHTPSIRWMNFTKGASPRTRSSAIRLLKSMAVHRLRDFPPRFWSRMRDLELKGIVLMHDVPEYFRQAAAWSVVIKPWSYWRYPLGVLSSAKRYLYDSGDGLPSTRSSSVDFQIKTADPEESVNPGTQGRESGK